MIDIRATHHSSILPQHTVGSKTASRFHESAMKSQSIPYVTAPVQGNLPYSHKKARNEKYDSKHFIFHDKNKILPITSTLNLI